MTPTRPFLPRDPRLGSAASERRPGPADELRALARQVRRIGDGWRDNPEAIAEAKDSVAHRLNQIARELENKR